MVEIDGFQRAPQGGDRFQKAAHQNILAVAHAAFDSAGAIRAAGEAPPFEIVVDGVLHLRAEARRAFRRESDLDTLDCLHRDDRLRQAAVEAGIPVVWDPSPGGTPLATTSKTPPTVSPVR